MDLRRIQSQEAGFKYFVLGAFASAFLLYGIALLYGATGSTNLTTISSYFTRVVLVDDTLVLAGLSLLLVGLGFKVAAAPFHLWTPDVYDGSPSAVTAFMGSAVKVAGFAGMTRVLVSGFAAYELDWVPVIEIFAVLSLVVGALMAIVQTDVKRMLAFSSINHAGFLLMGVAAANTQGTQSIEFYLGAYALLVIGSFGVVLLVAGRGDAAHSLDDFRGLAQGSPVLASLFTVFLLAQAGVPLTSGFFAKFTVVAATVEVRTWWLAVTAMLSAVVAAFLYLRIIAAMWLSDDVEPKRVEIPFTAGLALWAALAGTLALGFFPDLLLL
jgi:NADH-quinone oxidoreductase subunit N